MDECKPLVAGAAATADAGGVAARSSSFPSLEAKPRQGGSSVQALDRH